MKLIVLQLNVMLSIASGDPRLEPHDPRLRRLIQRKSLSVTVSGTATEPPASPDHRGTLLVQVYLDPSCW